MVIKTAATVLLASALWIPSTVHAAVAQSSADDTMTIEVEIPSRSGAPTPPPTPTSSPTTGPTAPATPTASATPGAAMPAATPAPDTERPDASALPATGAQVALLAAALAIVAVVAGVVVRLRRRPRT